MTRRRRDLSALTPVERGILDNCLNERAWHTPTARCTVENMAEIVGCTERQVYRARRRLRDLGVIGWTLERARGARYDHAVYTIHEDYWKPQKPHERGRIARGFIRRRRFASRTQCQGEEIERKARRSTTTSPSIAQARSSPQRSGSGRGHTSTSARADFGRRARTLTGPAHVAGQALIVMGDPRTAGRLA